MQADTSRTGASFLAKRSPLNPRERLISVLDKNPRLPSTKLFRMFVDNLEDDPEYQAAVNWYFFINARQCAIRARDRADPDRQRSKAVRMAEERINERKLKNAIKSRIVLLDLPMPNGKAMRDCTGAEMAAFGDRYRRISERVGTSKLVGDVLSEDQVRTIMR